MQRKIPATMISQHPDHAGKPYWHNKEFISTRHETQEAFLSFSDLGVSEYKWDWEGKYVDESVIERLLSEHFDYFKENPLGKEKFLTFRLPNPKVETEFRLGRAFMGLLGAAGLAKEVGMHTPPLFEVILPMTETAEEMIAVQEAFREIAGLKHNLYSFNNGILEHIELIPLFEEVSIIMNIDEILKEYVQLHKEKFGYIPPYIRPYLARSDPALNAGIIPTVLAIKVALSRFKTFEKKTGIQLYPLIGSASLPFRGELTPHTIEQFTDEYQGIRTALLQSAFRYDYPKEEVIDAIQKLEDALPQGIATSMAPEEEQEIRELIPYFEEPYKHTIEQLAPLINEVASQLPKRRERVQHIGLFGYSRGVGKVKLPRAIGFTAAMYSLGIPPELVGTGRGLKYAMKNPSTSSGQVKKIEVIEEYYKNIKHDLLRAGRFVNKELIQERAKHEPVWNEILQDIKAIEDYLGIELQPESAEEVEHQTLTHHLHNSLADNGKITPEELTQLALLRKSLG